MPGLTRSIGIPTLSNDGPVVAAFRPGVQPSWDAHADVVVVLIDGDIDIPTFDDGAEIQVSRVDLPWPSWDEDADVLIHRIPV